MFTDCCQRHNTCFPMFSLRNWPIVRICCLFAQQLLLMLLLLLSDMRMLNACMCVFSTFMRHEKGRTSLSFQSSSGAKIGVVSMPSTETEALAPTLVVCWVTTPTTTYSVCVECRMCRYTGLFNTNCKMQMETHLDIKTPLNTVQTRQNLARKLRNAQAFNSVRSVCQNIYRCWK